MATKQKSRSKIASKRPARKAPSRRATRPRAARTPASDPLDGFLDAAARALAFPIEDEWRAAIKANLTVNLAMGAMVAEFPLPDETEPAPIFRA